jgi:HEPN domain-containing protein
MGKFFQRMGRLFQLKAYFKNNSYFCTRFIILKKVTEKTTYWVEIADYDIETAKVMLVSKRFLYVGFMCHQAIEKMIKAYFCLKKDDVPPFTHNLKNLAERCDLLPLFSDNQLNFIEEILPMNIEARYPAHKEKLFKLLTHQKCEEIIKQTEDLCQWIKQLL